LKSTAKIRKLFQSEIKLDESTEIPTTANVEHWVKNLKNVDPVSAVDSEEL
jgi:hypothetical protein